MEIIPAIDLLDNNIVRLYQGDFNKKTIYSENPIELIKKWESLGTNRVHIVDLEGARYGKFTNINIIEQICKLSNVEVEVGGGIRNISDIKNMLKAGADKVSINTAAVKNPDFVRDATKQFGSQCIVVAIDAKRIKHESDDQHWEVYTHGGRNNTGIDVVAWAKKMADIGAGEILLTSMDKDGTKDGFDIELTKTISKTVNIPVIASGGVGNLNHLAEGILKGRADAVLAASIFHFGKYTIADVKKSLSEKNIEVRL